MNLTVSLIHFLTLFGFNIAAPTQQPTGAGLEPRQQACNGNSAFCDRKYSNVSWIGTHDSAFVGTIIDPRVNQEQSVNDQLDAGIRFLQAQTHTVDNGQTLEMCHTSCEELDAGPLSDYLGSVKTWLDGNPDEVITMLLVNGDNVAASLFDSTFTAAGLKQYAFVPSTTPNMLSIGDWPTYAEMIAAGTRLVVFLDSGADESSVPYILDEVRSHQLHSLPHLTNIARIVHLLLRDALRYHRPFLQRMHARPSRQRLS
jgi:hypothetical protein